MDVLLAAENPDLRLALELLLHEQPGVNIVGSASEARGLLALIQITSPDLVIIEWELPGSSAGEVLRQTQAFAHAPSVVVMGLDAAVKADALAAGAAAFVLMGGRPDELLDTIKQAAR